VCVKWGVEECAFCQLNLFFSPIKLLSLSLVCEIFFRNAEVCDGGYWSEYVHYSPFGKNFDGYPEHFNY